MPDQQQPYRVLITGSRHATHDQHAAPIAAGILDAIGHLKASELIAGRVVLVHGDAPGVDTIAAQIVSGFAFPVRIEPHNARDFGPWPAAGPKRNARMVELGADICLAFPQRASKGTWDCARQAADAGIPVILRTLPAST